jgi:hypothetical protein
MTPGKFRVTVETDNGRYRVIREFKAFRSERWVVISTYTTTNLQIVPPKHRMDWMFKVPWTFNAEKEVPAIFALDK